MKKIMKNVCALCVLMTIMAWTTLTAHAVSLSYSGGSSSNDTGAVATTSGYSISYTDTVKNVCGYRFSVVTANGLPKSGTKVVNVFLSDVTEGTSGYSSADRFIISSGKIANKKQLANGTKVSSTTTVQSCDYKSGNCGFYSTLPQNPSSIGNWIKSTGNSYQNLQRIYVLCGTNLASATESDYVLIEPMFRPSLAGRRTVATATELAVYGAAVSGGDGYTGGNGNLYNTGSSTLWNLMNYVNREFPNALYVSSKTDVYNAVTIKTSSKYTYKEIIQNGLGCSVLTVKNVVPINKVYISYNANGGTSNTTYPLNQSGWLTTNGSTNIHSLTHGKSTDPYNATTFGLKKTGYQFGGWKVYSTGKILDQDTKYASTEYAQYNDKTKTTANTATVYCHLYAEWIPNVAYISYHANGGTSNTTYPINQSGWLTSSGSTNFHSITHGETDDPYNATTFGLKKTGYQFGGWKVYSTEKILNQDTNYASTEYAQYNDKSKTTANTVTVYCHLYAVWIPNVVNIAYHPNGGTTTKPLSANGFIMNSSEYFHTINYGSTSDPYNASTLALTRTGYTFKGWKVQGTETVLNQDTVYASTVYSQYDNSSKTTSNTSTVYCHLYAAWEPNVVKIAYHPNGGTTTKSLSANGFILNNSEYFHAVNYGSTSDPFNASSLALTRTGYTFKGWKIAGTETVLDQDTIYNSTIYSQYDNPSKNTSNTSTVYCHLLAEWEKDICLTLVPIEPNAAYRENTEVITSYWLVNVSDKDYTPQMGAEIVFEVYDVDGRVIAAGTQEAISPKNDKNLVYFQWRVADGMALEVVSVQAYIQESGNQYGHVEENYTIAFFDELTTPDTEYEAKAPDDFSVPTPSGSDVTAARWWRWVYSGGVFVKKEYAVCTAVDELTLLTPTNPSAYMQDGILHMKSGYGFECWFTSSMAAVDGYNADSVISCVEPQYFYAQFPEYNYAYSDTTCRSFQMQSGANTFIYLGTRKRQHFTPIYYPDGPYIFEIILSDCWTPAGMLTGYQAVTIQIEGNMFDDWYIGRK